MSILPAPRRILRRTLAHIHPALRAGEPQASSAPGTTAGRAPASTAGTEPSSAQVHPFLLRRCEDDNNGRPPTPDAPAGSSGTAPDTATSCRTPAIFAHRGLASVILTLATDGIDGLGPETATTSSGHTTAAPHPTSQTNSQNPTSHTAGPQTLAARTPSAHTTAAHTTGPETPATHTPTNPDAPYLHGRPGADPRIPTPTGVIVENTRAAFRAAEAIGVDYIETDCRLDGDGRVVFVHDPTLRRILGDERSVRELSTAELAAALEPVGGLITVDQALREFPTMRFNIDCKTREAAVPLGRIAATHGSRVLVTSFDDGTRRAALTAAQQAAPGMVRPATSPGKNALTFIILAVALGFPPLASAALRGVDCLQIPERQGCIQVLTPRLLRAAHSRGIHIHVWTVNDPENMRRLAEMGVDGIISDRADLAVETYRGGDVR